MGSTAAPKYLAEARAELVNPERRKQIDIALQDRARVSALGEFKKFLDFALTDRVLTADAEANLEKLGRDMGLSGGDIAGTVLIGLKRTGSLARVGAAARRGGSPCPRRRHPSNPSSPLTAVTRRRRQKETPRTRRDARQLRPARTSNGC